MKRLLLLLYAIASALLVTGCAEPGEKVLGDKELYVYPDTESCFGIVGYSGDCLRNIAISIGHSPQGIGAPGFPNSYWNDAHTELVESMRTLWKNSKPTKSLFVEYSFISSISISADKTLFGRMAGEDLSDKIEIVTICPLFQFPDGDLLHNGGECKMTSEEWNKRNIMTPENYKIYLADSPAEDYTEIVFTITERGINSWQNDHFTRSAQCNVSFNSQR